MAPRPLSDTRILASLTSTFESFGYVPLDLDDIDAADRAVAIARSLGDDAPLRFWYERDAGGARQVGVELVSPASAVADAEVLALCVNAIERAGLSLAPEWIEVGNVAFVRRELAQLPRAAQD